MSLLYLAKKSYLRFPKLLRKEHSKNIFSEKCSQINSVVSTSKFLLIQGVDPFKMRPKQTRYATFTRVYAQGSKHLVNYKGNCQNPNTLFLEFLSHRRSIASHRPNFNHMQHIFLLKYYFYTVSHQQIIEPFIYKWILK